jgi:D-tyrosyl-tRNA(Tyr) deacylase
MRVVIQRVKNASVEIAGQPTQAIGRGLLIFIGIEEADNHEDIDWLVSKIAQLRIFEDEHNRMNLDIQQIKGSFLVISQFTLHASTRKGNRPSFIRAARPEIAVPLYTSFIDQLKEKTGLTLKTGIFGAHMDITLLNDGPVTLTMDSKNRE